MRKILSVSAAVLLIAALSSCNNKQYTCTCVLTKGTAANYIFTIDHQSESKAKTQCSTYQSEYNTAGANDTSGATTASCTLN